MVRFFLHILFLGSLCVSLFVTTGCVQHQAIDKPKSVDTRVADIERHDKFKTREEIIRQQKIAENSLPDNAWEILKQGFSLEAVDTKQTREYEQWLAKHPLHVNRIEKRVNLVLPYIIDEIKSRNLPLELALVPIIESGISTFATSPANAAGLWQIMPKTAKWLGLQVGDSIDERRNIIESTKVSLEYLKYLADYYDGNWPLGITSYNAGNGTVDKALKKAGKNKTFLKPWKLPLTKESRVYFTKLMGLRNYISKTGKDYPSLDPVPMVNFFTVSRTAPSRSFNRIARQYNTDVEIITFLNADYLAQRTLRNRTTILIPKEFSEFNSAENFALEEAKISLQKHKIRPGDSLSVIARKYSTTVRKLKRLNALSSNLIRIGQTLLIPIY